MTCKVLLAAVSLEVEHLVPTHAHAAAVQQQIL